MGSLTACTILAMAAVGSSLTIQCPVEGQVFTDCGSPCPPTCTTPNPFCVKVCEARCECPKDTVIDEVVNACVALEDCTYQPAAGSPTCPPDLTPVNCVVDPCMFATCPAHPGATCIADYCGACNARFFDATGNEVTDSCDVEI